MNWWPFGKEETVTLDVPHALLADIEKRGKHYLDDVDNGKLVMPACKRSASDAGCNQAAIAEHTRLEAFRYLLAIPRREFTLLAEPGSQVAIIDGYLRQLPHEDTVIEFTGVTNADLAIAIIAGFNWLVHCAVLAGAGSGTMELRFLASNAEVQVGDTLVTSGLDGVYLPGLPVAKVVKIDRDASFSFARIHCAPLAGVERHGHVLVLGGRIAPTAPEEAREPGEKAGKGRRIKRK